MGNDKAYLQHWFGEGGFIKSKENLRSLLLLLFLFISLIVSVAAAKLQQSIRSKAIGGIPPASHPSPWVTKINPEIVIASPGGEPVYLSTLLVDATGQPISLETTYQWTMSSTGSLGILETNGNIATFKPLGPGKGDLVVKASNMAGIFIGSAPVFVGEVPPPEPVNWKSRTSWLRADYFYFTLGARDVGERVFTGRPDSGTVFKIDEASAHSLKVSWIEWGTPLSVMINFELAPEFLDDKLNYLVSSITISDKVVTDTYKPVWTTRAGYAYTSTREEALLPVAQSHPDLIGILNFKNISWHPGIWPLYDLDYTKWSWKHVQKILPTGIMPPVADGLFEPLGEISRADMALFLLRAYEYVTATTAPVAEAPFTDISHLPTEIQTAIKKIYGLKITAGTSATTYAPEIKVNRAQMATFLSNLYKAVYGEYAPEVPVPFADIWNDDIKWAQKPIARIYGLKVTAGISPTEFGPYLLVTREQMATFIMNFIEAIQRIGLPTSTPTPIVTPAPTTTPQPPSPPPSPSPIICEPRCGDGVCQQVVCQGLGCTCAESTVSCPQDCITLTPSPLPTSIPTSQTSPDTGQLTQTFSGLAEQLVSPPPIVSPFPTSIPQIEIPPEAFPAQVNIFLQILNLIQNFFTSLFD